MALESNAESSTRGRSLSVVLLATTACNAACDYCFEDRGGDRLDLERLRRIIDAVLAHMDAERIAHLTLHWQGGEALLLPPRWYAQAQRLIDAAAAAHGKQVEHGLQTNLLGYGPDWDDVIAEMFGNSISTSVDYPNRYRRLPGGTPADYDRLFRRKLDLARAAGIDVKAISVLSGATLAVGAAAFYAHMVDDLGITDFQINTPFPGGESNTAKAELDLDLDALTRFHCDLADLWLERADPRVRIGPFDALLDIFRQRDGQLPCIFARNCTDLLIAIDPAGNVAQCDCWVTSYPEQHFGNLLASPSLTELLRESTARRGFIDRPVRLMAGDCIDCDYLALCHGGCPVRTYAARGRLAEKDPYCALYRGLFAHMEDRARRQSSSPPP